MPYFGVPIRNGLPIGLGTLTALAKAVAVVVPPVSSDPYFEYVSLLANTTSTNGAQNNTFLDSSTNAFSVTRNGNTTQGTFSPFSQTGWSNYFDGTGDYLTIPANAAFQFGTGDFTIECWINKPAAANGPIVDARGSAVASPYAFYIDGSNFPYFYDGTSYTSTVAIVNNQWNHVAVVKTSGALKIFVNGVEGYSAAYSTALNPLQTIYIGGQNFSTPVYTTGYISNLRIVKGTAVYTNNFTPPTSPLTAISGTSLLTCQSNRFIDNSSNAFAITRNGDVSVQAFSPFNPTAAWSASTNGGSGYFDGTGDYLAAPDNAAFEFGNGDYTTEAWVYLTGYSANYAGSFAGVIFAKNSSNADLGFYLILNGTASSWTSVQVVQYYSGATNESTTATSTLLLNTWYHIAATRSSGSVRIFINGVQANTTATFTQTQTNTTASFTVGGQNFPTYTYNFPGYISDARVVKGTAVYTANFTPPTAPLTAITNTSLLLNFTNAGIYDSASGNDLETVGNAQVSTVQAKWGTTSMAFDGTGDWLIAPDRPPLRLGTANFTIEGWVYLGGVSPPYSLLGKGTSTTGWNIGISSLAYLTFTHGSTTITSSSTITPFAWTHFAIVRGTSNLLSIYQNGVQVASAIVATDFSQTNPLYVGASRTTTEAFVGYIDDLRITNGYARYTANFTPPTAAFPLN